MPPLLDRQRRGVVLGQIRIGIKVTATNRAGKTYERPEKLSTFRLTAPERGRIDAAAELYGGTVTAWEDQWQVVTETSVLPVRVPPGSPVEQNYELWAGRPVVRQRLCDGFTERMRGGTCKCPADLLERKRLAAEGGACKPITKLTLVLADLPGLGVWTLASGGDSAADELAATAELLRNSAAAGIMLPAALRLEQRESRGSGELHKYAVPVLDVATSLIQLENGELPAAIAAPTRRALTSGPANDTPDVVDAEVVEESPGPRTPQDIADAAQRVHTPDEVKHLGGIAKERGWLNEHVRDTDGSDSYLENVLYARLEAVGGLG